MLKGKKWLVGLCAVLLGIGFASCSEVNTSSDNGSDGSSTSIQESESTVQPTVTLSSGELSLDLFERETLTASLQALTGEVVWTTSDANIVAVEDGLIRALGVGTATITATVGEYSATCAVTVARGELTPEFDVLGEDITVMKNKQYTLDSAMSVAGEEFNLATVTFRTEGDCVSVDENGLITALAYGEQDVTVTATYGDIQVEKTFTVTVYRRASVVTGITANRLELAATAYDWDKLTEYSVAEFKAEVNEEEIDVPFTYSSSAENVATVEDGKIVAKGVGEATITVQFVAEDIETQTKIFVTVVKESITRNVGFESLVSGGLTAKTGTLSLDLSKDDIEISLSEVTQVCIGEEIYESSYENDLLKVQKVPGGYHNFTLKTPRVDVTVDGLAYMGAISTKADLLSYATNMDAYHGYAILTNDIDMEGESWSTGEAWQRGTLDGKGYTVSNIITKHGFVKYQSQTGVVKNIQLVNVLLQPDIDYVRKNRIGFFGEQLCGTWENVLVIGKIEGATEGQALAMGCVYQTSTVMKNVIIVANTDDPSVLHTGSGYQHTDGAGAIVENVYYVCDTEEAVATCSEKAQYDGSKAYKTVSELLENETFNSFSEWTVSEGNLPYMNDYTDQRKEFATKFEGELKRNGTLTVRTTLVDGVVTVKDEPEGITVNGKTLTLTANGLYTIVVTSASDPAVSEEYQIRLVNEEIITYNEKYVLTDGTNTKLDLSKLSKSVSVSAVMINNDEVEFSVGANNILTFANKGVDKQTVVLFDQTAMLNYKVEVLVADYAVTDLASYKAFWTTDSIYLNSKYMVITANINCGDAWIESKKDKTLSSVIDGLGHTISNVNTSYGLFGGNTSNITVKNVTFDNFMMADYGSGRLLGRWCNNMVYENVHFTNFTIADNFFTKDTNCLFSWVSAGGAYILKLTNCTFDIKCSNANVDKEITFVQLPNKYVSYFTNVTINYNGTVATYDETITHNSNGGKVTSLTNVVINDKTGTKTYNN